MLIANINNLKVKTVFINWWVESEKQESICLQNHSRLNTENNLYMCTRKQR